MLRIPLCGEGLPGEATLGPQLLSVNGPIMSANDCCCEGYLDTYVLQRTEQCRAMTCMQDVCQLVSYSVVDSLCCYCFQVVPILPVFEGWN